MMTSNEIADSLIYRFNCGDVDAEELLELVNLAIHNAEISEEEGTDICIITGC